MSWDKRTVNMSRLGAMKGLLDDLGIPYSLSKLANFDGAGSNDCLPDSFPYKMMTYSLWRLAYRDTVILERLTRTTNCDTDDIITSHEFKLGDEPKNWGYCEVIDNA